MEGQSIMALLSRHQVGSFRVPQIAGQLRLLLTQLHATLRNEEQVMPLGDLQSTQGTTTTNGNPALSAGLAGLDVTNGQEHQESKSPTVKESKSEKNKRASRPGRHLGAAPPGRILFARKEGIGSHFLKGSRQGRTFVVCLPWECA